MYVWLYVFLGCTCACVCRGDGDDICVGHDLSWCSWWWYVCSVYVECVIIQDVGSTSSVMALIFLRLCNTAVTLAH